MGEPANDTTYSVTVDRVNMGSAAKAARNMIGTLERGIKAEGFNETSMQYLVTMFIVIGQYTRGSGWAGPTAVYFTTQRPARPLGAGQKHSQQLLLWAKKFEAAFDPKPRREAFDKMQQLMFDFVWTFKLQLAPDKKRAAKFDADIQKIVQQPWHTLDKFYN